MLTKAALLVLLLVPLFSATSKTDTGTVRDSTGDNSTGEDNSNSSTGGDSETISSETTPATTSGSSWIVWTNELILAFAVLLE